VNSLFALGFTVTLTQLAYAVAIDTHRHFERAAHACNVTQPALSMQVQTLETALGAA
jgi:LysR family hydrogen peroxide-inducible transcriptional activator